MLLGPIPVAVSPPQTCTVEISCFKVPVHNICVKTVLVIYDNGAKVLHTKDEGMGWAAGYTENVN